VRLRALQLAAAVVLALAAPSAAQAAGLTATFSKSSDWGSGYVADYSIKNGGSSTVNGWRLEFDLPLGATVVNAWNGQLSSLAGHDVVTNAGWNATIAPGAGADVGFQVAYTGTFAPPQSCLINGQSCSSGSTPPPPPPDTTPPSAPTGLTAGTPTTSTIPLTWNASTDNVGVTGYQVYNGTTLLATTTSTSTTISGLTPSTSYTFTVKATDAAGNTSTPSNPITASTATPPTGGLTATFFKSSDWGSGYVGGYTIKNGGSSTVNGWRVEFDLPSRASVTSAWSGVLSSSGNHYVLTDASWTHTIAPGGSVQVGFQVAYTGTFAPPQSCLINGQSCSSGSTPPPPPPDTTPPSAPTGLTAGTPTTSTIPLTWNASTDNVGVTGYQVYNGTTLLATTTSTSTTISGLTPSTSYTFTVKATDAAGNTSTPSNPITASTAAATGGGSGGSGSGATAPEFAPYVDMTLYPQFSLGQAAQTAGIKHFTLAFIVSGGGCSAAWGGVTPLTDSFITTSLANLKAAGGDAVVSFGGEAGQELASTCSTPSSLAAQYQSVIDQYGIRDLDFDIEGAAIADAASIDRRFKALAQVQAAGLAAGKPVHVSLTLPVMPTGLTQDGVNVVRSAIMNGVEVGQVNVMAMDYFDPSLSYAGHMGDLAIQAAQSTHDQLATLYSGKSDSQLWAMVGVTPMIGINDDNQEIFTTADAAKLTAFANSKGLGRLAFWSANRDAPCPAPTQWTSNTCSGVPDPQWAFSKAFEAFPSSGTGSSGPGTGPAPGITVSGNQLVDGSGATLRIAGVNRSGSEYACAQGWGMFDGPTDDASTSAITTWGINAVRVPLNEDCWLGINGVNSAYAGSNYQVAVRGYVNRLLAHGLDVILDLHWGAPGTQLALGQEQAPDADHSPAFWSSVASQYKGVTGVAFDLFNEPHDVSWSCWLNGCAMPGGWQAAGEQQLINAVRGAGATQPVIVEGLNWGGDLSGWSANAPRDPAGRLVAGWHIYNFSGCNTMSCWDSTVAPVAQQVPVLATEIGENDCGGSFLNSLLPWADSHRIGYVAWAWNNASCGGGPSLISDYSGTPTAYGAAYKAYLTAHPVH
jgi:chitodextrinase